MPLAIAYLVADRKVFCMAVAALAERLNVLQRGGLRRHMFAANPARHHTVQLTGNHLVDLVAGMAQSAHSRARSVSVAVTLAPLAWLAWLARLARLARLGIAWLDKRILPVRRKPADGA